MEETQNSVKVSVIVPAYNAAKTLPKCLDSILNQTMPDFELICINDGSADNTWEVMNAYSQKDARIRIVEHANRGLGETRNRGMELAVGEYIVFVDADDYIMPMSLETICGIGFGQNADIVLYDGDKFDTMTGKRIPINYFLRTDLLPKDAEVFSAQDCPETIFQVTVPSACTKAFRREFLVNWNLRFPDYPNSEDVRFTYSCMAAAERIAYTTQKLYMYRVGQTTNMESGKAKAPLCFLQAYLELADWLMKKERFDLCKKSFGERFCTNIIHAINTIDSAQARQTICQRLCAEDVARLHVLDQSDAFYGNNRNVRQVHWLLNDYLRECAVVPKVSIIIPVFNVERYLADCLESLLNQTMPDFEVLCIDDGSTDNSRNILTLYSRLDSRIKVIYGDHQGAAEARNQGIDLAAGEYLYFMDSDDKAADALLEKAYTAAVKADADVVVFDAFLLDDKTRRISLPTHILRKEYAPMGKTVFFVVDLHDHIFQLANPAPWTKLFKREYVMRKQLRFQNLQNSNDAYFVQMGLALADRITLLDERLYFYRTGMANNIQSKKDKAPDCIIDVCLATHQKLVEEGIWTLCERSWVSEFLAMLCFAFKTISKREAYKKLYYRLNSPEIMSLGIFDHQTNYYQDYSRYELVTKFLSSPIKFADAWERDSRVLLSSDCPEPVVSVIVPVYNVESYLPECLASIQNQTLRNIEIICVDDGSTDASLSILCQAAERDNRIQVLVQKNSGQSAARNAGIQAARGKYLYYIDADDMLEPHALQSLTERAEENDLDCLLFGGKTFYESEELCDKHHDLDDYYHYKTISTEPIAGSDLLVILKRTGEYRSSPCMQFVKSELVCDNGIRFYEGVIHEDELYTLEVLLRAQRCMVIQDQPYLRRIRDGSTVTASSSVARLHGYLVCYTESLSLMNRFELTAPQYDAVYQILDGFVYHIQKNYFDLSGEERLWVYAFCTGPQRCIYNTLTKMFSSAKPQSGTPAGSGNAAQNKRLNDHDTALRYAQEELAQDRARLNDHDTALGYLQQDVAAIQRSLIWKIDRILTWLPRKIKRFFRRGM